MKRLSFRPDHLVILLYFHVCQMTIRTKADPAEAQPLINFMNAVDHAGVLSRNWTGKDPCVNLWKGVTCRRGFVYDLILESIQLNGTVPDGSLNQLSNLRRISLFNNSLSGPIPDLSSNSRALKGIWLHQNSFNGSIPDMFSSSPHVKKLYLANNKLSGSIPTSLSSLPRLSELHLENNLLTGSIPPFNQTSLTQFNVSSNQLNGEVPHTHVMQNLPLSSIGNNPGLCGHPLTTSCPASSEPFLPNGTKNSSKLSSLAIIGIVLGDFFVLMIITLIFFWYYRRKYTHPPPLDEKPAKEELEIDQAQKARFDSEASDPTLDVEKRRLVFFNNDMVFDLEDLLRASAELLGKGSFGTAYKAVIENGPAVTVKRLRDLNSSGEKEFKQQMLLIGGIKHPNLVPLRAYYYAKDEKLLVYDYMPNGSLFDLLHGNRGPARNPLEWKSRLKIARSVARGLAYLHHECQSQKIPHGNVKSSNVLMDENMEARLTDFGLVPLTTPAMAAQRMVAFKAPEYANGKKINHKSDVYSYGVLLLELLTGKIPASHSAMQHSTAGVDLPKWVNATVREEWTSEVFDIELGTAARNTEEEMMNLLQIAMSCVDASAEQRPKMSQVQRMIEEVRENKEPSSPIFDQTSIDSAANSSETRYPASPADSAVVEQGSMLGSSDCDDMEGGKNRGQSEARRAAAAAAAVAGNNHA